MIKINKKFVTVFMLMLSLKVSSFNALKFVNNNKYAIISSQNRHYEKRRMFTQKDDKRLIAIVKEVGVGNWKEVAQRMGDRNERQCRARWKHYLSVTNNDPWSTEEDEQLLKSLERHGNRWTVISKELGTGRSDIQCKNRLKELQEKKCINSNLLNPTLLTPNKSDDYGQDTQNDNTVIVLEEFDLSRIFNYIFD